MAPPRGDDGRVLAATGAGLRIQMRMRMRIGSELSSNEAIKQMCAAGFGPAFLSLQSCRLEIDAGLLVVLPIPRNRVQREWFSVHLAARQLPQVVLAFDQFLRQQGQTEIHRQAWKPWSAGPGAR